jgi:hypothetical protein
MESNKNDNNNNGDNEHQQPQRTAQKRKFNQLTNDEEPAEAAGEEGQDCTNSKKNREEGNDLLDLEVCTYFELETKIIDSAKKQL